MDVAIGSKSEASIAFNCLIVSFTQPADDTTSKGVALMQRFIFLVPFTPSWGRKFLS